MQMQLPLFPNSTNLINFCVGFFEKEGFVYYLHNGSPIYCHEKNDLNSYRYIMANLIVTKLCTPSELANALGVSNRNIQRYAKTKALFPNTLLILTIWIQKCTWLRKMYA
jgi:hypothetical protein